jgi:hypothetical protein
MDVLGDLVARDRRDRLGAATALSAPAVDRSYTWRDFCTNSYKAGNVLRFLGVRAGARVEVADEPVPEPVLAFLGAAQLGAVTRFEPRGDGEARAVLVPVDREPDVDAPPGTKLAIYGGSPTTPSTTHWEQELWSENPQVHPADVDPGDPALVADGATYSHAALLDAAGAVVDRLGLSADDAVAVRGSLADPGVVAAGLVAPLLAGGCAVVGADEGPYDAAVGVDGPESRAVVPEDVLG